MRTKYKALVAAAATMLVAAGTTGVAYPDTTDKPHASAAIGNSGAVLHLFQWPWKSVAGECTNVLGPAKFPAIEVSPPQEHVVLPDQGYPWWQDYQPVSYKLDSRRGSAADFADMVKTCDAAGVDVYVDAVINHMAGGASTGNGSAGSTYSHYDYPSVPYGTNDFHHCGRNGNDDIVNWTDQWEVRNCELVDLADLATDTDYVRGKITDYLNGLIDLGVDGFRVDAAKHIAVDDLSAIYGGLHGDPKIFQEVSEGGQGEVSPTDYTGLGRVTEFRYGDVVGDAFKNGSLDSLSSLDSRMLLKSSDAMSFIDNHDTQRNGRAKLTYKDGARYQMAEAFEMAHPYGTPHVLSGFTFDNADAGPPANADGTTKPAVDDSGQCADGWDCTHRKRTVLNMGAFRTTAGDAALTNWWSNGSNQIAFGRGDRAFAAFNASDSDLTTTFATGLPAGTYCDVANGDPSDGGCSGPTYTVDSSGTLSATVPAGGVMAVHVNAMT
ncbi:MAG TPA: alpha-amylase family protein [Stackebrandtia sp.]|jgi:alpha-amylase|uniref:alpha-amylase n=1 Tax=Stackebrandtia sp. TaxID=2023065 RepID=UPI002D515CCA|nr:alpha-amylase family protein [Stackebrandtia sp.]HZE39884.1 alpha-amylase family protein [Stackebrandtia sp.]